MERLSLLAPAKVNLRLLVLERQISGYHSLETVFCALGLSDRIEIGPGEGIDLQIVGNGIDTGPPERNLVVRAVRAFYDRIGGEPALRIRLEKRIPSSAGLGGGSSDAAATLRLLNALHREPLNPTRLLQCGAEIGSDVPFFLTPKPFALAWGRGERLVSLRPPRTRPVVVVHSGIDVPTGWAFERLSATRAAGGPAVTASLLTQDDLASWERVEALATNDFEAVAAERIPDLRRILDTLRGGGARIAMLAGSGGAVYGVFESSTAAERVRREAVAMGLRAWRTRTLRAWPHPRSASGATS